MASIVPGEEATATETLAGPVERPLLSLIARRLHPAVTPDLLTSIGVAGAGMAFFGFVASRISAAYLWLVLAGVILNWLGDGLDGTVARVRGIERPVFGSYLDRSADVVSEGLILLGLGASPYVDFRLACLAYAGCLALSVLANVRWSAGGAHRLSYARIGPTELRVALGALTVMMLSEGVQRSIAPWWGDFTLWDVFVALAALGLWAAFATSLVRGIIELSGIDSARDEDAEPDAERRAADASAS